MATLKRPVSVPKSTKQEAATDKAKVVVTAELETQENIIQDAQKSFFAMALAIMTICQKELFAVIGLKQGEYFMTRWSLNESQVSRYKKAGEVLAHLKQKFDKLPENEGQARALAKVIGEDLQAKAWAGCLESGEAITAKSIAKMARRIARTGSTKVSAEEKEETNRHEETKAFVELAEANSPQQPEIADGYKLTLMTFDQKSFDEFREVLPTAKASKNTVTMKVEPANISETLKRVADLIGTLNTRIKLMVAN